LFFVVFVVGRTHPTIHATSHVDHVKRGAWFSVSMHVYGSVPIGWYGALFGIWAAGALQ